MNDYRWGCPACPWVNTVGTSLTPDGCFLGRLPGVKSARCGHGGPGYIWFENDMRIEGNFTVGRVDVHIREDDQVANHLVVLP